MLEPSALQESRCQRGEGSQERGSRGCQGCWGCRRTERRGFDTQTSSTPGRDAETLCNRELNVVASQMTAVLRGPATPQEKYCKLHLEMSMLKCPGKKHKFPEGRQRDVAVKRD